MAGATGYDSYNKAAEGAFIARQSGTGKSLAHKLRGLGGVKMVKYVYAVNHSEPILLDDVDYEVFKGFTFMVNHKPDGTVGGVKAFANLGRALIRPSDDQVVDHIDRNPLNNTKANLRVGTHSQNCRNRGPRKGTSSKFKGVRWYKQSGLWCSKVTVNGRDVHVGYFYSESQAAVAYDTVMRTLYPDCEFLYLNFPERAATLDDVSRMRWSPLRKDAALNKLLTA